MRATTNKALTAQRICNNTLARRESEKQELENMRIAKDIWGRALNGDLKAVKMIFDLEKEQGTNTKRSNTQNTFGKWR